MLVLAALEKRSTPDSGGLNSHDRPSLRSTRRSPVGDSPLNSFVPVSCVGVGDLARPDRQVGWLGVIFS